MLMLRLDTLRRGVAEYGSPSLCWRVKVEASSGGGGVGCGGGVGGGSGESERDCLTDETGVGCGALDFRTWTDEGWSEETCFSRDST